MKEGGRGEAHTEAAEKCDDGPVVRLRFAGPQPFFFRVALPLLFSSFPIFSFSLPPTNTVYTLSFQTAFWL